MRKSRCVTLTILAAFVATGCDDAISPDNKQCVDENGVVQDESHCATIGDIDPDAGVLDDAGQLTLPDPANPGHYYVPHFRWYYFGGGGYRTPGTRIYGGGYRPSPGRSYSSPGGRSYSSPGSIGRGGFGSTGHGFGGGGG